MDLPTAEKWSWLSYDDRMATLATLTGQPRTRKTWWEILVEIDEAAILAGNVSLHEQARAILDFADRCLRMQYLWEEDSPEGTWVPCGTWACKFCGPRKAGDIAVKQADNFAALGGVVYFLICKDRWERERQLARIRKAGAGALPIPDPEGPGCTIFTNLDLAGIQPRAIDVSDSVSGALLDVLTFVPAGKHVRPSKILGEARTGPPVNNDEADARAALDRPEKRKTYRITRSERKWLVSQRIITGVSRRNDREVWAMEFTDEQLVTFKAMLTERETHGESYHDSAPYQYPRAA
jgi:hypothetical protein